jgi:hypothetical protein
MVVKQISARTPLDCASAQPLVDVLLLEGLDPASAAALEIHLSGCASCSAELRGMARLIELMAVLPEPAAAPDLDQRVLLAAVAARQKRHEHHSWLQDLPRLVVRGAMRTTGTLVLTLVSVALLGGAFVFAAGTFLAQTALAPGPGATVTPEVTPTLTPTPQVTAAPTRVPTEAPVVVAASAIPTPEVTVAPTAAPTPAPTVLTVAASPAPTPEPTPTPTDKPRRTPPPTPAPSPTDTAPSSAAPSPSP